MSNSELAKVSPPRLPYPAGAQERFGIDKTQWKALVEAIFPAAKTPDAVILACAYCKSRNLDVMKRQVHIVPIWDGKRRCEVETVWPGIGELRTTAFRTGQVAGRDATEFGPNITKAWERDGNRDTLAVTFPEWSRVTFHRLVRGQVMKFVGPQVFWLETYASLKDGTPNSMWQKRPRGQLDKCAEAAALRAAFPEEVGSDYIEAEAFVEEANLHGIPVPPKPGREPRRGTVDLDDVQPGDMKRHRGPRESPVEPKAEAATEREPGTDEGEEDQPAPAEFDAEADIALALEYGREVRGVADATRIEAAMHLDTLAQREGVNKWQMLTEEQREDFRAMMREEISLDPNEAKQVTQ